MIVWGGQRLYTWLISEFDFAKKLLFEDKSHHLDGTIIPVLEQRFDFALLISWGVTIGAVYLLHRFLNRERSAEFLIETDEELKKVTWPSWADAKTSSLIVLVFILFMAAFLAGADFILSRISELLFSLFGAGS
ncbi:MAG: preprotein translocase subunit SecE [Planctomycetes bacterium]|nr:preprotein translocase subunit SecE [Planctomycetota bacterium]